MTPSLVADGTGRGSMLMATLPGGGLQGHYTCGIPDLRSTSEPDGMQVSIDPMVTTSSKDDAKADGRGHQPSESTVATDSSEAHVRTGAAAGLVRRHHTPGRSRASRAPSC